MRDMSSIDIFTFIHELKQVVGCKIVNIYQFKNFYNFKIRCKNLSYNLLIEPGLRIHFTNVERNWTFTNMVITFRRHLKDKFIRDVHQLDFDRIIIMDFDGGYRLYIELLKRGNIVLTHDGKIIMSTKYVDMRDRRIKPGLPYTPPPNPPPKIYRIDKNDLKKLLSSEDILIKSLIKLGLGKKYSIDILKRLGLEETSSVKKLTNEEMELLVKTIKETLNKIENGQINPTVYFEDSKPVDFAPWPLTLYENHRSKTFNTFSEALDFYYSYYENLAPSQELNEILELKKKLERRIKKQKELIDEYRKKSEKYKLIGFKIYEKLAEIRTLLDSIRNARKKMNLSWEEIISKFEELKKSNNVITNLIEKIDKSGNIYLNLDITTIKVSISTSPSKLAEEYFEKSKKLERKIKNAEKELERTLKELNEISTKEKTMKREEKVIVREPIRKWYHKFRWFFTSEGYLVVAGRDADSNERLVKNYLKENDIFLHAEIHGAAATILKDALSKMPEESILEAAEFAAAYSSAWKKGLASIDVFWCPPSQVSLTPPSGTYLVKGSFIIKKKNYIKNVPLRLSIGVKISKSDEGYTYELLSAPPSAISKHTDLYVNIRPGNMKKSEAAKQIKFALEKKVSDNPSFRKVINSIKLEKIIDLIPGPSILLRGERSEDL